MGTTIIDNRKRAAVSVNKAAPRQDGFRDYAKNKGNYSASSD